MGKINIGINNKKGEVRYEYSYDKPTLNELTQSLAFLEIIKQKLMEEIEDKSKKYEEEEN